MWLVMGCGSTSKHLQTTLGWCFCNGSRVPCKASRNWELHPGNFPVEIGKLIFSPKTCVPKATVQVQVDGRHRPRYVPYPYTREMIEAGFNHWISLGFSMMRNMFLSVICMFVLRRFFKLKGMQLDQDHNSYSIFHVVCCMYWCRGHMHRCLWWLYICMPGAYKEWAETCTKKMHCQVGGAIKRRGQCISMLHGKCGASEPLANCWCFTHLRHLVLRLIQSLAPYWSSSATRLPLWPKV